MNPVIVIPTFVSARRRKEGGSVLTTYDHATPISQPGELPRLLASLQKVRGAGQIIVLVVSEPSIENQAAEKVQSVVSRFPSLNTVVIGAPELALIQQRMEQRSDWAYKELVALLKNIRASGEDALSMPGSIYGAVGLCQFMPTNISHYGADGNGDGVVNLFDVPDAVASLSNYLARHGWNKAATRAQKQKVIKTYNRIDIYANTILGLAEAQGYVAE